MNPFIVSFLMTLIIRIENYYKKLISLAQENAERRLVISGVNTTNCGLRSLRYHANKLCNFLPDNVRVSASLAAFKIALKTLHLNNECCSFCDKC